MEVLSLASITAWHMYKKTNAVREYMTKEEVARVECA